MGSPRDVKARNSSHSISDKARQFLKQSRVARMATVNEKGRPFLVPICFAYFGGAVYSALDQKPKSVSVKRLRRVRNIKENPHVALLIDYYEEDWTKLSFLQIQGKAKMLSGGTDHAKAVKILRQKYPQYRLMSISENPVIKIIPSKISAWGRKL